MLILGIESSCDDTAAAVVEDGTGVLSSVVSSQDSIHGAFGGIVPELASRKHIEMVIPVVEEALARAGLSIDEIDAIGVTNGPGLVGSLLIGLSFAKGVSFVKGIPYVGVNHIEAHPLAAFLQSPGEGEPSAPGFPFIALVVSGGHTSLVLYTDFLSASLIGETRDDAAGEAFDKVAKLLGLGYPGGAAIDRLALEGDPGAVHFKRSYIKKGNLEFSFSGIKTAVLTHLKGLGGEPTAKEVRDIAASFQEAAVDVLTRKILWAAEETGVSDIVVAGGVACNSRLRTRLKEAAGPEGLSLFIPPPVFCSDNAAMIACSAYHRLRAGERAQFDLNADPNMVIR